jgi:hypothetical protein
MLSYDTAQLVVHACMCIFLKYFCVLCLKQLYSISIPTSQVLTEHATGSFPTGVEWQGRGQPNPLWIKTSLAFEPCQPNIAYGEHRDAVSLSSIPSVAIKEPGSDFAD